ncbi:MAG: FixH family protein [Betaproteobacteria bacterium]
MSSTPVSAPPGYRQRGPGLLTVPPAAAVIGCAITITLAIVSNDGVVAADYYRQGLAINERLARNERALALGIQAQLQARGVQAGDAVLVQLQAAQPLPPEASLAVRLVHPGRSGADRRAVLARRAVSEDGRSVEFVGQWAEAGPVAGEVPWRLVLDAREWRIDGDASLLGRQGVVSVGARP